MRDTWTYKFEGHTIIVKNSAFNCELYVDDSLQDKQNSLFDSNLTGKLPSGEEIKASLGGLHTIKCSLFIDNKMQEPVD